MKIFRLYFSFMIMLLPQIVYAQQQIINYFSVGGDVCLPVTVKHSRGSFTFSSNEYRVDGPIDYVEAWDCQGRKILDTTPDGKGYTSKDKGTIFVYYYSFKTLYPQSSTQEEDGYEGESEYYPPYQPNYSDSWDRLMQNVERKTKIYDPAYPNLTLQAGLSNVYGEYFRAKACLGGRCCYVLYGGIGHDWLFKPKILILGVRTLRKLRGM